MRILLPIIISMLPAILLAQEVDDIIGRNVEARGGAERWEEIRTLRIEGIYQSFSVPNPFTIYRERPNRYRFDHVLHTRPVSTCFNGQFCWWVQPFYEIETAEKISTIDSLVTLRESAFEPVFWNYRDKGNSVQLEGVEEVDGVSCYKLRVLMADSLQEIWYLDRERFLEVKMEGATFDFTIPARLEAYFQDWRSVDGVMFPFLIEQEFADRYRMFRIEKVAINTSLEGVFDLPVAPR